MSDPQFGFPGLADASQGAGQFGAISFLITQALAKLETCTPVRVLSVTNDGGLSPVGFVDVQPLINQLDAAGNAVPHAPLYQLMYFRLQGGKNAMIIDPEVGDIGMAAFASRDTSKVKETKAQANPGSWRSHSMADGMYFGGLLNGTPSQYIQFSAEGINIISPSGVSSAAPVVKTEASESASITSPSILLGASGDALKAFVTSLFMDLFNNHTHPETGSETGPPTQQMNDTHLTQTVKGS